MLFSGSKHLFPASGPQVEHVLRRQDVLHRVMGFTGKTIDDVVNCPIAKRMVLGYYKVHRQVERRSEIVELEQQWNPLG